LAFWLYFGGFLGDLLIFSGHINFFFGGILSIFSANPGQRRIGGDSRGEEVDGPRGRQVRRMDHDNTVRRRQGKGPGIRGVTRRAAQGGPPERALLSAAQGIHSFHFIAFRIHLLNNKLLIILVKNKNIILLI
jgi:hypothetical protein